MAVKLLGKDVVVEVLLNGKRTRLEVESFDESPQGGFVETDTLGESRTSYDTRIDGYGGTLTIIPKNSRHREIADQLERTDLAGTEKAAVAIQVKERYSDGSRKPRRYVDVALMPPSTRNSGRKEGVSVTFDWRASRCVAVK